jgi:benzylsuccinate CoA-transferase BbsF subunit
VDETTMPASAPSGVPAPAGAGEADLLLYPFRGLRVADFAWVIAGPLASQYLAVHGADVIHIESRGRMDVLRANRPAVGGPPGPDTIVYFSNVNQGKRGITLNLRHPRAVELAKRLVATCDVVTENFTPGTMDRLGLGYEALRQVRPDLIMISMALAGQTGPERSYKGFGTVIQGAAGITHFTGWPDRPPAGTGVAYTDFFASHVAAFALLCALDVRRRTGRGQYIDLSQQEASMYGLDAALLDYTVNGRVATRQGNRHPTAAPHGAFPCSGTREEGTGERSTAGPPSAPAAAPADDRWVAVAVYTDAQWQGLVDAMGRPAWAAEERFATLLGRKAHEDELEERIAAWTTGLDADTVAARLRAHGVPAAVVADAEDLHRDPQLLHRGHFLHLNHPVQGDFPFDALSYHLNGRVPQPPRAAPLMGQHNVEVYRDLLGLSEDEYRALEQDGAFS